MRLILVFLLSALIFASCDPSPDTPQTASNWGYVPVYANPALLQSISVEAAQPTTKAGKIYAYGSYVFQNDVNKGIHIIDNSNPAAPHKVSFLKVPYSTEIAVKGSYLYTNCINDLLVLDLQNPQNPVVVKRVQNAFPLLNQEYPPFTNVYFVCPDPAKGIVVDWQYQQTTNLTCRR